MSAYTDACNYIDEIPKFAPKTGLDNTRAYLKSLGNPEQKYKIAHIAGTNGKGSVAKMMALMLESAGYKTGLFISPHLVKMNERISINGEDISDEDFTEEYDLILEKVQLLQEEGYAHPAYFEFLFCMAADYFAETLQIAGAMALGIFIVDSVVRQLPWGTVIRHPSLRK